MEMKEIIISEIVKSKGGGFVFFVNSDCCDSLDLAKQILEENIRRTIIKRSLYDKEK